MLPSEEVPGMRLWTNRDWEAAELSKVGDGEGEGTEVVSWRAVWRLIT